MAGGFQEELRADDGVTRTFSNFLKFGDQVHQPLEKTLFSSQLEWISLDHQLFPIDGPTHLRSSSSSLLIIFIFAEKVHESWPAGEGQSGRGEFFEAMYVQPQWVVDIGASKLVIGDFVDCIITEIAGASEESEIGGRNK